MCLSSIQLKHKPPLQEEREGFKILITKLGFATACWPPAGADLEIPVAPLLKSPLPLNRWHEAVKVNIDTWLGFSYTSGFHVYASEEEAKSSGWCDYWWQSRGARIFKVKARGIMYEGKEDRDLSVFVAEEIFVIAEGSGQ